MSREQTNGHLELAGRAAIHPESVRAQTERVLADPIFQNSQRSSKLLRFIVDRTLNGRKDELKERIIGIEVFGRATDYDTASDPTVRVAAKEVRKRLADYYAKLEHKQELRIEVPIRSYVAEFKPSDEPTPEPQPPSKQTFRKWFRLWYVWLLSVVTIVALGSWAGVKLWHPPASIDEFWSPVAGNGGAVLICVGAPLDMDANVTHSAAQSGASIPLAMDEPVQVGTNDSNSASDLAAFLRRRGKDSEIRPVRGEDLAHLSSQPLVLYGRALNEWAANLGANLHFRLDSDVKLQRKWIGDTTNPSNRTWSTDPSIPDAQLDRDYALITRVKDQTTGRRWIGIAGLTGMGTVAANRIALDPNAMGNIAASLPKGWEQNNLQIVLEVRLVHGSPGASRVVAMYSW